MNKKATSITVGTAFLLAVSTALAQRVSPSEYSVDSKLVLLPVCVTDRSGAFVTGLRKDAFTVSEDGVGQPIRSFSEDEAPVSTGIVLDTSGSMKSVLPVARESLLAFAALANPADEAFLTTVSSRPHVWSGFTGDIDGLVSSVAYEPASGSTALIDSIWVSLDQLREAKNVRKALVVVSDGADNHSRHTRGELLERASEADVQIYAVSVFDPPLYIKGAAVAEQQHGMQLMQDLASRTGGIEYWVRSRGDIEGAVNRISNALRSQYNIGYIPASPDRSGRYRRIQVRMARAGLKAHTRTGYRLD